MAADKPVEPGARPTIPFDYLAVAEELHSGRIKVSTADAAAEYRTAGESLEAELKVLLHEIRLDEAASEGQAEEITAETLPIEPEAIAVELGLEGADLAALGRLRRVFALRNHPDRVPQHLRQRALQRMQVANRLIDEAKRRALAKTKPR